MSSLTQRRERIKIHSESKPSLPRFVKMRHDSGRGKWIILAPERVFNPDEIAVAVLKRCDGKTSVANIATTLANEFKAPVDMILNDIVEMLQDLTDKGVLDAGNPST
ncbi:MAG: pyrroloquinoline quinone biosynthesis peptide chaperone PqqD [Hyphomicrobium sp.]